MVLYHHSCQLIVVAVRMKFHRCLFHCVIFIIQNEQIVNKEEDNIITCIIFLADVAVKLKHIVAL